MPGGGTSCLASWTLTATWGCSGTPWALRKPGIRKGHLLDHPSIPYHSHTASQAADMIRRKRHVSLVRSDHNQIVGVVGDRRGKCPAADACAFYKAKTDMPGVPVPLYHCDFQDIPFCINSVPGIKIYLPNSLLCQQLSLHKPNDPAAVLSMDVHPEICRRKLFYVEGAFYCLPPLRRDLRL